MRLLLMSVLAALAAGATSAEEKKGEKFDAKKLVGKWVPAKQIKGFEMEFEFTKDGKMTLWVEVNGQKKSEQGTYELKGDKLIAKFGDTANEEEVLKLTDEVMELRTKNGTDTFNRVKNNK